MLNSSLAKEKYTQDMLELIMAYTSWAGSLLVILVIVTLVRMEKKYRKTFYSTETGGQMNRRNFLNSEDDAVKKDIVTVNKSHRLPIKDEIEQWVRGSWVRWIEEKPDWFTDGWKKFGELKIIDGK
jgi:hypothetical protein